MSTEQPQFPSRRHRRRDDPTEELLLDFGEDEITRAARLKVALVTQWIFAALFLTLVVLIAVGFPPWSAEAQKYDVFQTSWALVWSTLMLLHIALLLVVSHVRYANRPPPRFLYHLQRLLRSLNTMWFFCGIKPLFWDVPYNENAIGLARSLWWTQAGFFLIPLFVYLMICLCMPCILLLLNRLRPPTPNELPTPEEVLAKLEVRKYDDLIEQLRREFGEMDFRSSTALLHDAISRNPIVEVLTTAATGALPRDGPCLPSASDRSPLLTSAPARFKIESCCPICMADFEGSDTVMVMPCDKRHFYHTSCIKVWLKNSQFCPICRANIVALASEASHTSAGLELQPTEV